MKMMHPFERKMVQTLEKGGMPSLDLWGGPTALLDAVAHLGRSPLMPEFLRTVLRALPGSAAQDSNDLSEFVCQCIEMASDDFVFKEIVEILDESGPLPDHYDERCFDRFLGVAAQEGMKPMTRAAALDGALRWAVDHRSRQLRLLAFLLGVQKGDDPIFLARSAKIIGVAYGHWREAGLLKRLKELASVAGVEDEAAFELGMANLLQGIETGRTREAADSFDAARYWFKRSVEYRAQRPDARLYAQCLDVLIAFSGGETSSQLHKMAKAISEVAFEINAWHRSESDPPWLGARNAENVCWSVLAVKLTGLAARLDQPSWLGAASVVEECILVCYQASRSILKRRQSGGVERLVRPRIHSAMAQTKGQAFHLKQWLESNSSPEWREAALELSCQIDALMRDGLKDPPSEAAIDRPTIAALVKTAQGIPSSIKTAALKAIQDAHSVHLANLSDAEFQIISECVESARRTPDYQRSSAGRALFNAVLVFSVRFLYLRLEMTQGSDPGVSYLFDRGAGSLPKESELQKDYHSFMFSNLAKTDFEVSNVGGGRADVHFSYAGERIVTEAKTEKSDCSFDGLEHAYAAQTTDYQNVSIRLGFLLVLDLTEKRSSGTPHISTLVTTRLIIRKDETIPRLIVMIKVPGRRLRPSDLTKEAGKTRRPRVL